MAKGQKDKKGQEPKVPMAKKWPRANRAKGQKRPKYLKGQWSKESRSKGQNREKSQGQKE
jgi:hypothetical protein